MRIESAGAAAVISGDVIHHPVQISHPDLRAVPDADPAAAAVTRDRLLQRVVDEQAILLGTHFPTPTAGTVTSVDGALRWVSM